MQNTVLLAVTRTNLQARAAICSAVQIAQQREGRAVIFDKTGTGFVRTFALSLDNSDLVDIVERPRSEYLYATIHDWGCNQASSGSGWVQIISDDDSYLLRTEAESEEDLSHSMYVCPTLFLYENDAILENGKLLGLRKHIGTQFPITRGELPGDTAWHGLVRNDVFIEHSKWVRALPIEMACFSNLIFWSALVQGEIGRMRNFAMIKSCIDSRAHTDKIHSFYSSIGLQDDPPGRLDSVAYWPTVLALLLDRRKNLPSLLLENSIATAGAKSFSTGLGIGFRNGGLRGLKEMHVQELRRAVQRASIVLAQKSMFQGLVRIQFSLTGSENAKLGRLSNLNDKYLIPLAMESLGQFPEELRPLRERLSASFSKWI